MQRRQFSEALDTYREASVMFPRATIAIVAMARVCDVLEDLSSAAVLYKHVRATSPYAPEWL